MPGLVLPRVRAALHGVVAIGANPEGRSRRRVVRVLSPAPATRCHPVRLAVAGLIAPECELPQHVRMT